MIDKPKRTDRVEVASDQLKGELVEIKERLSALETIASISNREEVEKYVRGCLTTPRGKQIMVECAEPKTRKELVEKLSLASGQALDNHLRPLRRDDLLQRHVDDDTGIISYEWSNLFKGLPKKTIEQILK